MGSFDMSQNQKGASIYDVHTEGEPKKDVVREVA